LFKDFLYLFGYNIVCYSKKFRTTAHFDAKMITHILMHKWYNRFLMKHILCCHFDTHMNLWRRGLNIIWIMCVLMVLMAENVLFWYSHVLKHYGPIAHSMAPQRWKSIM
jgi:hypothetical protein